LRVSDTGHGMSEEVQSRVFEPFFTTKDERGTGLGLSTVYGIVKQSDGYIWCDSEPGNGTTFTVYLPRNDAEAPKTIEGANSGANGNGSETVLVAEDEELVRRLVQQLLVRLGYSVLVASNGVEALERLEEHQGDIDLLLTDVVMPAMNGRELAAIVRERFPAARVLFMSGYNDEAVTSHGVLQPGAQLLEKPFTASSLGSKVRAVLDGPSV
jgi:two-component system cell cycle sensor histidine kinase/response regulator CckA